MVEVLISLLILVAIFGICWWFLGAVPMPEPLRIVVYAVVAIIAILLLVRLMPAGRLW